MNNISEKTIYSGKWLLLKEKTFAGNNGEELQWEYVSRKNEMAAVTIIPLLLPSEKLVLIRQFRPPTGKHVLGFPAGICSLDSFEQQALIELKEETGYQGRIVSVSPILQSSPAVSNSIQKIIHVEIDENDPHNQNPEQTLEPAESIETVLVKNSEIKSFLEKESSLGNEISAALWFFALNSI